MSLEIIDPERNLKVLIKMWSGKAVHILPQKGIDSMTTIDIEDFCIIMEYVLQNADLEKDDPRIKLLDKIKGKGRIVPGYNKGGKRINLGDW